MPSAENNSNADEERHRKKTLKPDKKRDFVRFARQGHGLSERQACSALEISRSVNRYEYRLN